MQDGTRVWQLRIDRGRSPLTGWLAFLLAAVVLAVSLGPLRSFASSYAAGLQQADLTAAILARAATYLIVLSPLYVWALGSAAFWERRARIRGPVSPLAAMAIGLFVALLASAVVLFVLVVTGCLAVEHALQAPNTLTWLGIAAAAALVAFQAGAEEMFFRGWLQPILVTRWGVWPGVIAAAALFAAAHGILLHGWLGFVNVVLAGLLFGLLALRTGSTAAAVAAHGLWNWLEQSVFGLTPNPGVDPLGTILDLKIVGPAMIGAGPDELTGSLYVTLIFALFVVVLIAIPGMGATSSVGARRRSGRVPEESV